MEIAVVKICGLCHGEWTRDTSVDPVVEDMEIVVMEHCSVCLGVRPGEYRESKESEANLT
jgi:hypothetical protein